MKMFRPTLKLFPPGINSESSRSLLDRPDVRISLLPQLPKKGNISFSPTGYYDDETDINMIHNYVLDYHQNKLNKIPKIEYKIRQLDEQLKAGKLKITDRKSIERDILAIQKKKTNIETKYKQKEYLEQVLPILSEWSSIRDGNYVRFGDKHQFSPDRLSLVRNFIQIANNYAPLNLIIRPTSGPGLCPYCRKTFDISEEGKNICDQCGIYEDTLVSDVTFSDRERINGSNNSNYNNRERLEKALACYQGKENCVFPPEMQSKIDNYCIINHINKYLLKPNDVREIFKKLDYSNYYDDANLFLFLYINRALPDLSQHEDTLLQDSDLFNQEYQLVKGDDRDSSLNAQYVLYILVRRRKIAYDISNFKLPDTRNIRLELDRIARKVFQSLDAKRKVPDHLPWIFTDTI